MLEKYRIDYEHLDGDPIQWREANKAILAFLQRIKLASLLILMRRHRHVPTTERTE